MMSYWEKDRKKKFKKIEKDEETSVCVIGGGLTGLSVAYYLSKFMPTILLEKNQICDKTSSKNTGKVTSQHGLFYNYLINSQDQEFASKYLEANQNAIDEIEKMIKTEKIDCDFEREDSFVFTQTDEKINEIENEYESVKTLNKDLCEIIDNIDAPIKIKKALKFKNQAKIHPVKYGYGLANAIEKNNGKIFEEADVTNITHKEDQYEIEVNNQKVYAKYVVLTTRYPIMNFPGYYFLKMYQSTSFAMVFDCKTDLFEGMYISADIPTISFRTINENGKKLLLVVGYDYKTGTNEQKDGFNEIEKMVKKMYPNAEIVSKWTAEDCITLDKIPYIGKYSNIMSNLYIATGFNKWGITSSNIAGQIICDLIKNKDNKYEEIFKSTRLEPIKNRTEMSNMIKEANESILLSKFKIPIEQLKDIKIGEGKIVNIDNNKIGVYRYDENKLYKVKPICTHLGCELSFNNIEKIWECPCHGSKFNYDGISLETPSNKNLEIIE